MGDMRKICGRGYGNVTEGATVEGVCRMSVVGGGVPRL